MRRVPLILAVAVAFSLVGAQSALATRYATSTGSATNPTCAQAAPCTLQRALAVSTAGEEVILAQGDYHVAAPAPDSCTGFFSPGNPSNVGIGITNRFVHGIAGRPRPRIIGGPATCFTLTVGGAGKISHLELDNSDTAVPESGALVVDGGGSAYDVLTGGTNPRTQMRNGGALYNSVLHAGADGIAERSYFGSSNIINVTGLGKIVADSVPFGGQDIVTIACVNSVATGGFLALSTNFVGGSSAGMTRDHCAGATLPNSGPNTSNVDVNGSIPNFSLLPNDYHQLIGSPTVDNGTFLGALQGTTDIDGGTRFLGTVDIGADEFGSGLPILDSGHVVARAYHSATVTGSANPGGLPTGVSVEYGPNTAYGQRATPVALGGDFATHPLAFALPAMTVNSVYHYRFVASNGGVTGEDRTITFADADHDGSLSVVDCNEANPLIHPGAIEIVGNTIDENCDGVAAPFPTLGSDVSIAFLFHIHPGYTLLTSLVVTKAVKGSTVKLRCSGHGCPFKTRKTKVKKSRSKLSLTKLVKKGRFRNRAKLELVITSSGHIGKDVTLTFRNGHAPKKKVLCLTPGHKRPSHC